MKDNRELLLAHKDRATEQIMDNYPQAKIPNRISALIGKRVNGLRQQGV